MSSKQTFAERYPWAVPPKKPSGLVPPTAEGTCRPLAEKHHARGVIVLMFDAERSACASYGATKAECRKMARLLDRICNQLDSGALPVWEE